MVKCSRVGCDKVPTRHRQVAVLGMLANVWGCDEHFDEVVKSLEEGAKDAVSCH